MRRRLQDAALALYQAYGYDQTTTAEIAAKAGVTERTFFRHFPDKREVLFDGEAALSAILSSAIATAPPGLDPWAAMILAFRATEPLFIENRASTLPKRRIIEASPALQERALAKTRALTVALASALRERGVADRLATLAAQMGLATLTHAVVGWFDDPAGTLDEHVTQAFQDAQTLVAGSGQVVQKTSDAVEKGPAIVVAATRAGVIR